MSFLDSLDAATRARLDIAIDPPECPHMLQRYMQNVWGLLIPSRKVCEDCCSPLEAFWMSFANKVPKALWLGPRGGGKSYQLTGLAVAKMVCYHIPGMVIGGSEEQSKNVINALNGDPEQIARRQGDLWDSPNAPTEILGHRRRPGSNMQWTVMGGYLKAVPASMGHARGKHPVALYGDEIDEMRYNVYRSVLGAPAGLPERQALDLGPVPAQITLSSTWQHADGTVAKVRDEMLDKGLPVFKWCIHEVMKKNGGWMADSEYDRAKANMTKEDFDIEILMKAPSSKDQIFSEDQINACMPTKLGEWDGNEDERITCIGPHPKLVFIHGCDWGRSRDWSVFTVLTENPDDRGTLYLAAFERHGGGGRVGWPLIKKLWALIRKQYRGFRGHEVLSTFNYALHDATGMGGKMINEDFFEIYGDPADPFDFSDHKNRRRIFQALIEAIQNQEILMPRIKWLKADLLRNTDRDLFGEGHPSDSFISLALAYEEWQRYRRAKNQGVKASRIDLTPQPGILSLQELTRMGGQIGSLY